LCPFTPGPIGCLAIAFCYRIIVRFSMDQTYGSFLHTNRDKQGTIQKI
jgi:hypothetical protein